MKDKRYAIYGGSFDPIHIGHIKMADCAVRECSLDKLIFMPAYVSPFKLDRKATDGRDRCGMIRASLGYNQAFCLSTYELRKGGTSYTVETLRYWREILGGNMYFLLGFDSMVQLDTWFKGEEILRNYHLITARRPGSDESAGMEIIGSFREKYGADITILDMDPVDASSTEIRTRIHEGRSISDLVLPGVEEYIIGHGLYR